LARIVICCSVHVNEFLTTHTLLYVRAWASFYVILYEIGVEGMPTSTLAEGLL